MKKRAGKSSISALAALTIFALFAACVLCVLLSGAGIYRRLVDGGQEQYARRTLTQYVATRVQQSENAGCIGVEPFGEGDALVISQVIDTEPYRTRIYCHEGWLMELFAHAEGSFEPGDGERLLRAEGLECELEAGMLTVTVTDTAGVVRELVFALRGGEGAIP